MGEGEGELLGDELLDVGALDVLGLLELNDLEDLYGEVSASQRARASELEPAGPG